MLLKRGKNYYCRLWVPDDLRERIGKKELKKSLKTTTKSEARVAAVALESKASTAFFRMRAGIMTERELEKIAAELIGEFTGRLAEHKQTRKDGIDWMFSTPVNSIDAAAVIDNTLKTPKTTEDNAVVVAWYTGRIVELEAEISTENFSEVTRYKAKWLIHDKGLKIEMPPAEWFWNPDKPKPEPESEFCYETGVEFIPEQEEPLTPEELKAERRTWNAPPPAEFTRVCIAVLQAQIDAYSYERERIQGKLNTSLQQQIAARIEAAKPKPMMSELYDKYKTDKLTKQKWNAKTLEKYEGYYKDSITLLRDKELASYGSADVCSLIDALRKAGNTASTISGKLEFLSSMFKFAIKTPESSDTWKVRGNPFADQQPKAEKSEEKPTFPYSLEELIKLVTGLLKVRKLVVPHRFWVPLIAIFSGMRQGEICQLRTCDIEYEGKIPVFKLWHRPEYRQKMKWEKERTCPVHPMLEKLGFLDFIEEQKKQKRDRLFHTLDYTQSKEWTGKIRSWWNETYSVKTLGVKQSGKSFRSTRKNFIDWFKQNGAYDTPDARMILQSMVGHDSENDVTGKYYEASYPAATQYKLLCKLNYGFDAELISQLQGK